LNPEAGVTVLEMAIALLILTVGLLALAGSIGYANRSQQQRAESYQYEVGGGLDARADGNPAQHRTTQLWPNRQRRLTWDNTGANPQLCRIPDWLSAGFDQSPDPDGIFGTSG
jgi:hypothetical protein